MEFSKGVADLSKSGPRKWIEQEILPEYLKSRRWFASKDKAIKSVRLSPASVTTFDGVQLLFAEINIKFDLKTDQYQLPLGLSYPDDENSNLAEQLKLANVKNQGQICIVTDAFCLDALPRGLLAAMQTGATFQTETGQIRCFAMPGLAEALQKAGAEIKRLSAEQSNSSLVIGNSLILKLIRRIMPGVNPEVEMVRYLTENAYPNTPPLLGEVQNIRSDGSSYSMYVVQKFIPNQGDAWTYTLDYLCQNAHSDDEYRQFIHAVGTRLAQLHEVLARPTDDKSFTPCAAGESDIRGWITGASRQIELAFDVLESSKNMTGASEQDRRFVLKNRQHIVAVLPNLGRAGLGALLTRVHGDFHLGQVLVAEDDAYIIDFEGEPSKPLDERRAKSSPMRDVAGLLRSLQYAAGASEASDQGFVSQMSDVFLSAYRAVHRTVQRRWVKDETQESDLLDLFLLEKCAYEICYEAANRPNWLPIPLRGFSEIIARILRVSPEMRDA